MVELIKHPNQHHLHGFVEFKTEKNKSTQNFANYFQLAAMASPVLNMDIVGSDGKLKYHRELNVEIE